MLSSLIGQGFYNGVVAYLIGKKTKQNKQKKQKKQKKTKQNKTKQD